LGEEKKEENWLLELCGGDVKLYAVLSSSLPLDPIAALPKEDLGVLIEAAEKSVKDENYEEAFRKYRSVVDKAIFEATQHQEEKDRYIKLIQDLLSKTSQATEKLKEKVEKQGLTDRVVSLERRTEYCKFVSERIEDVLEVARHFYDEKLKILGEKEKGEERREAKSADRMEEDREEREERPEKRDKKRLKEKRDKRLEEDKEEKREKQREKETGEVRRKKILEARK
jgi:hypothetical protein